MEYVSGEEILYFFDIGLKGIFVVNKDIMSECRDPRVLNVL